MFTITRQIEQQKKKTMEIRVERKRGDLGEVSFRIFKLGELSKVSFGMLKLVELGEL